MSAGRPSLTLVAATVGAADTAVFLARRPGMVRASPGRAAGSAAALALWLALARTAARDPRAGGHATALAATLLAGNAVVLGVHLRHRIAGPRVFVGVAASAAALAGALRGR